MSEIIQQVQQLSKQYKIVYYVDQVVINMKQKLSDNRMEALKFVAGERADGCSTGRVVRKRSKHDWQCPNIVYVYQPSAPSIDVLETTFNEDATRVTELHIAADIGCESHQEAAALRAKVERSLVKKHPDKGTANVFEGQTYYSSDKRWKVVKVACYSDRPSKIDGRPCCHIELRLSGTGKVRELAGVERPADVLNLDFAELFRRHVKVVRLDMVKLGKHLSGVHGNKVEPERVGKFRSKSNEQRYLATAALWMKIHTWKMLAQSDPERMAYLDAPFGTVAAKAVARRLGIKLPPAAFVKLGDGLDRLEEVLQ